MSTYSEIAFYQVGVDDLQPRAGWLWLRAALAMALAILAFAWPSPTLFAFALVFAGFNLADGVLLLAVGVRRRRHRSWLLLRGFLSILVAAIFLGWPGAATVAYAVALVALVAAWALVCGLLEIVALARSTGPERWLFAIGGLLGVGLAAALLALLLESPVNILMIAAYLIGSYALLSAILLSWLAAATGRRARQSPGLEPRRAAR